MDIWQLIRKELHQFSREVAQDTGQGMCEYGDLAEGAVSMMENCISRRNQRIEDCLERLYKINQEVSERLMAQLEAQEARSSGSQNKPKVMFFDNDSGPIQ